jgi:hypothetical protein
MSTRIAFVLSLALLAARHGSSEPLTAEECLANYKHAVRACEQHPEGELRKQCLQDAADAFAECLKEPMGACLQTIAVAGRALDLTTSGETSDAATAPVVLVVDDDKLERCRKESAKIYDDCRADGGEETACYSKAIKAHAACLKRP